MPYWITVGLVAHAAFVLFLLTGAAGSVHEPRSLRTFAFAVPIVGLALVVLGYASYDFACEPSTWCGWLSGRGMLLVWAIASIATGAWLWRMAGQRVAHRTFQELAEAGHNS